MKWWLGHYPSNELDNISGRRHLVEIRRCLFPRCVMWCGKEGVVALAVRRPRRVAAPVAIALAALLVLVTTAFIVDAVPEYVISLAPAFVLLAGVGLFGERRPAYAP